MIYDTLETAATNPLVARSEMLQEALEWAAEVTLDRELGRYDLRGDDVHAMVQEREPQTRSQRPQVEAHRDYIDLQYCFGGGEIIDWYPTNLLETAIEYNPEGDVELFHRPKEPPMQMLMRPSVFTLLFPGDAHVPMVSDGLHKFTNMIVFKIRVRALEEELGSSQLAGK